MKIFLAGATGVVGRPLVAQLRAAGHEVIALSRKTQPDASGVRTVVGDVFDEAAVTAAIAATRPDVVVHQLTALPPRMNPRHVDREMAATNRLRIDGTRVLIAAAQKNGIDRVVAQGICFAPDPSAPAPLDDDAPLFRDAHPLFRPMVEALLSLEEQVLALRGGVVMRYGNFYGPGTFFGKDGSTIEDIRRRRLPRIGDGSTTMPFIHVDDAARATLLAIEKPELSGRFNVTEDDPPTMGEWLDEIVKLVGAPRPWWVPRWAARFGAGPYAAYSLRWVRPAANDKAKRVLGWEPRHKWRETFAKEL